MLDLGDSSARWLIIGDNSAQIFIPEDNPSRGLIIGEGALQ
jgi:hypothetical protein